MRAAWTMHAKKLTLLALLNEVQFFLRSSKYPRIHARNWKLNSFTLRKSF
jgi:hypothetical protein